MPSLSLVPVLLAQQQAPNPIVPKADEMIWGTIAFFALYYLLKKYAFPPVQEAMEARTQRIRERLDEAESTREEAQRILEDYQRQLSEAKNESSRIIEEARQTAEQLRRDLREQAESEVAELRQRATDEIAHAQERALADLRAQVSNLAIEAAEVVVQKNLDRETNLALIERFIDQVAASR